VLQRGSGTTCAFSLVVCFNAGTLFVLVMCYIMLSWQAKQQVCCCLLVACWLQSVTWQLPPGCSTPCTLLIGRPWFRVFSCNECFQLLIVSCGLLLLSAHKTHNAWHMLLQFQLHSYSKVWCGGCGIWNAPHPTAPARQVGRNVGLPASDTLLEFPVHYVIHEA